VLDHCLQVIPIGGLKTKPRQLASRQCEGTLVIVDVVAALEDEATRVEQDNGFPGVARRFALRA